MKDFADIVIYNQAFLQEKAKIQILNAIDKKEVLGAYSINGATNRLASKLKFYAFDIDHITNSEEKIHQTTILFHNDHSYPQTLKLLSTFLPSFQVLNQAYDGSGDVDMTILLGADYINTQGVTSTQDMSDL